MSAKKNEREHRPLESCNSTRILSSVCESSGENVNDLVPRVRLPHRSSEESVESDQSRIPLFKRIHDESVVLVDDLIGKQSFNIDL